MPTIMVDERSGECISSTSAGSGGFNRNRHRLTPDEGPRVGRDSGRSIIDSSKPSFEKDLPQVDAILSSLRYC